MGRDIGGKNEGERAENGAEMVICLILVHFSGNQTE